MAKFDYAKRNKQDKARRLNNQATYKSWANRKATSKQKALLTKLGIKFNKNIKLTTASKLISEALKDKRS